MVFLVHQTGCQVWSCAVHWEGAVIGCGLDQQKWLLSSKCNADGFRVKFHFPSKMHTDTHPQNPLPKSHTNPKNRCAFAPAHTHKEKSSEKIQLHRCLFVPAVLFRWNHKQLNSAISRPTSIFQPCGVSQWHLKFEWSGFKNNPLFKIRTGISQHSISEGYYVFLGFVIW